MRRKEIIRTEKIFNGNFSRKGIRIGSFFFNEILNEKNSCFNKRTSVNISRARVRVNQETSKIVISEIRI